MACNGLMFTKFGIDLVDRNVVFHLHLPQSLFNYIYLTEAEVKQMH